MLQVLGQERYHLKSDEGMLLNSLDDRDKDLLGEYRPVEEVLKLLKERMVCFALLSVLERR